MISASYLRITFVTAIVTLFLFFTSAYISLRLGAMPWPIIFSIVVSAGLLRLTGRTLNRHDVNVAQAGGSIGGLTAAAVAFVLPGLYLAPQAEALPSPWLLALLAGAGGTLGVLLSDRVREIYIDEDDLPYPAGRAGGELIAAGFNQGHLFQIVLIAGLLTAAFALLRDAFDIYVIPVTLPLMMGGAVLPFLIAPMGVAGGYLLGLKTGINWVGGAVIGIFILTPLAENMVWLRADVQTITSALWVQNVGMGLVLGSGLAYLLIYGRLKGLVRLIKNDQSPLWPIAASIVGAALLVLIGLTWWASSIVVALVWVLVPVAAQLTGSTNLDPLEQFGLLATFVILALYTSLQLPFSLAARYSIAFFVAVATAVAGDIGHDFKSAKIVGTPPEYIVRVDLFAVWIIVPAIPFMLSLLRSTFAADLFTPALPAPQAQMVYNTLLGLFDYRAFFGAMAVAVGIEALQHNRAKQSGNEPMVLLIPLGIGIFLGWALSFTIAVGGVLFAVIRSRREAWVQPGIVIAAGVMGGEGIVGFLTATLTAGGIADLNEIRYFGAGIMAIAVGLVYLKWARQSKISE